MALWISAYIVSMTSCDNTAMEINTDSNWSRTIDPDMALGSHLGPDVTMVLVATHTNPDQHGPSNSMSLTLGKSLISM